MTARGGEQIAAQRDGRAALEVVHELDARGHDPHEIAQTLAGYCRDLAVVLATGGQDDALLDYAPSEREEIVEQSKRLELSTTQRWFRIILESSADIAAATWPLWAFEMTVLRLVEVEPAKSIASLLSRLDSLAKGAPDAPSVPSGAASTAIGTLDTALDAINTQRATFGAVQNRLSSTLANINTYSENISASKSRIMDADFAKEAAALSKYQTMQQAGIAILGQANAMNQGALRLVG